MKDDGKFEEELTCKFKYDMTRVSKNDKKNLANFRSQAVKNRDFILESETAELNQKKFQNNQIGQVQCENFILPWK